MTDFGLYLVMTNPKAGYVACAEAAVRAGVKIVQLRMKHCPRAEVVATGHAVRAVTRGTGTLFIVNDDPSIAVEVAADGVHVGQDDMPVAEVRARFPSLGLVGLSTHNPAQARAAIAQSPDYMTLGVETAVQMARSVPFPAVCIGGVDAERLPELLRAGARNFSVVRAVCAADDPYAAIVHLQQVERTARTT